MGQEYVSGSIPYEEVAAKQAENGIATYANGSNNDGTITAGYWVDWTREGGYSGTQGWSPKGTYTADIEGITLSITLDGTVGPTAGMSQTDVETEIDQNNGNLNSLFSNWTASDQTKLYLAAAMASVGCANKVD